MCELKYTVTVLNMNIACSIGSRFVYKLSIIAAIFDYLKPFPCYS